MSTHAARLQSFAVDPRQRADALARTHRDALHAVALRLCRSRDEAEDLVQDALERVVTRGDGVDAAHTWSWLVTVMHNLFIDECRRQRRRAAAEEPESGVAELAHASSPMSIDSPRPAWDHIGVEDVRAAVNELDEDHGAVYRMFAFEGRSYEEIARVTSLPRSTVGTRLLRARARLRRILVSRHGLDDGSAA